MLKTILEKLNGHAAESPAIAGELVQLAADRDAAKAELAALHEKRRALLLDDASDAALDRIEREIDRAEVRLEKLAVAEAPLRARLDDAKVAERRSRWETLLAAHREAAKQFLADARRTIEKHAAVLSIVAEAQRSGFAAEAAAYFPPTPNLHGSPLLAPDLIDHFDLALAPRERAAPAPQPTPLSRPKPTPRPTLQHQVTTAETGRPMTPAEAAALRAKRMPDDTSPLEPGQARVRVARSGFSPSDNSPQASHGQVVRMPIHAAERASDNGAVEIIETHSGTASPPQSADEHAEAAP